MKKDRADQRSLFCTEIIKNLEKYEGPVIEASSWEEAEAKAREAVKVIGKLG